MRRRHESLHPLTHHHHHALVAALKLRRAGTNESEMSLEEIKNEVQSFWEPGGREHFREEEEVLLTAYARHASLEAPEISEMLLEHVQIRALVQEILEEPIASAKRMNTLGNMLEAHVRKEERVIFPMIEDALPEEKLQELAPYLHTNYEKRK